MICHLDSIDLSYDDVGTGAPVVFLHAFPFDHSMWTPQVSALMRQGRCIVPDLRGFGASTAAPPYSMDRYADDVAELLAALGLGPAVIIGLSMGGYIAFAFWRRHRALTRALVLADTRAAADTDEGRERRRRLIEAARSRGSGAIAEMQIASMVGATTRARRPDVVETVRAMMAAAPVDGVVGALEAMLARPDSTPTLATIDVPTLVVVGEEDTLTPPAEARSMHERIRGSRFELIVEAGHISNLERPAAFTHVVNEFVAGVGRD